MFFNLNKSKDTESFADIKHQEYTDLLADYNRVNEALDIVDSSSERFDALCLDLKVLNHRIAAVRKELSEI